MAKISRSNLKIRGSWQNSCFGQFPNTYTLGRGLENRELYLSNLRGWWLIIVATNTAQSVFIFYSFISVVDGFLVVLITINEELFFPCLSIGKVFDWVHAWKK